MTVLLSADKGIVYKPQHSMRSSEIELELTLNDTRKKDCHAVVSMLEIKYGSHDLRKYEISPEYKVTLSQYPSLTQRYRDWGDLSNLLP